MGYKRMRATSLADRHVEALFGQWKAEGLSAGTLKNRLACLRWWAEKVGKVGVLPTDNTQLGVEERRYVTNVDKSKRLAMR